MTTAQGNITTLQTSVGNLRTDVDTTGDVLNGIYPLVALGDVTMYQNVKEVLDNLPTT